MSLITKCKPARRLLKHLHSWLTLYAHKHSNDPPALHVHKHGVEGYSYAALHVLLLALQLSPPLSVFSVLGPHSHKSAPTPTQHIQTHVHRGQQKAPVASTYKRQATAASSRSSKWLGTRRRRPPSCLRLGPSSSRLVRHPFHYYAPLALLPLLPLCFFPYSVSLTREPVVSFNSPL